MGTRSIKLPDVGEGIAEAELVEWSVKVGDIVKEDQVVAAVMTDKATVEIPTPVGGTVLALGGEVGAVMAIGSELIRLDVPGVADQEPTVPPPVQAPAIAPEAASVLAEVPGAMPLSVKPAPAIARPTPPAPSAPLLPSAGGAAPRAAGEKPLASPAVRQRAREAGIELAYVPGTGPAGRITQEDLDRFIANPVRVAPPSGRQPNLAVEEVRITGLRRRIAQNMAEATRRIAHFTYVDEVDITALEETRAAMNAAAGPDAPKLTLLPFLMLALVKAIARFPQMNAHFDDEADIVRRFGAVHLGIATQTPSGLMVPVVHHAEALGLHDCARAVKRLSEAARQGHATREELSGSTITITSLGALGGIVTTPVINRPEVAIIGVNKMQIKPVWQNNAFVPRRVMNLSSSFDHRVIDGYDAAEFIQAVRALLETPAMIFVEP